jgi:hypothetical protein
MNGDASGVPVFKTCIRQSVPCSTQSETGSRTPCLVHASEIRPNENSVQPSVFAILAINSPCQHPERLAHIPESTIQPFERRDNQLSGEELGLQR